ncbi:TPA: hypothetical protein ACN99F_003424, partial [Vibrio metschnikovii]
MRLSLFFNAKFTNEINYKVRASKLLEFFILFFIVYVHFSVNAIEPSSKYSWLFPVFVWCYGVYASRKSIPLLVFYVFIFPYIFIPYQHYVNYRQISIYTDFQSEDIINQVAFLNTIFLSVFSFIVSGLDDSKLDNPRGWCKSNSFVFYLSLIPCFISIAFGLSGESIISSGYGSGLSSKSSLHEYFIVFSLFPLLFMNRRSRLQYFIWILLALIYSLKTILYGGRIEVIQVVLLWCFVGSNYMKSYSKWKMLLWGSIVYFVLSSIGIVRGHFPELIAADNIVKTFVDIILSPDTRPYVLSTSADVYYASMRLMGMIKEGYIGFEYRFLSFTSFIFNFPMTFSSFKELSNLASFQSSYYLTGGGGLISAYLFVWMSYFGVFLGAFLIGLSIRLFYTRRSLFLRTYVIMILVTFPRWWAYTPINLTKLCFVSVFMYLFYLSISSVIQKRK